MQHQQTSLSRLTHRRNAVAAIWNSSQPNAAQPYVNQTPTCTQNNHTHKFTHILYHFTIYNFCNSTVKKL